MDYIEYFKILGITTIPYAGIIGVFSFLGRKNIDSYFSKNLEEHKEKLSLLSRKNSSVFEAIHTKKIDAISEVNSKLGLLYKALSAFVFPIFGDEDEYSNKKKEIEDNFSKAFDDFTNVYLENNLFISDEINEELESIIKEFKISTRQLNRPNNDAYKKIIDEFPKALNNIRKEFNKELEKFEIKRP